MKFKDYLEEDYITESIEDLGIMKACFMSGQAASGKSYVISRIKSGKIDPRIVNTDTWVEYYKQFDPDFDWKKYGMDAKRLVQSQLVNYINSLLPMWIDSTSSNVNAVLRRKGILQSLGYDVAMIFVDTPVEDAIERNKKRNRKVDKDFLEKSYEKAQKMKSYYASEFRNFTEILNGEGELNDKVIIEAYKKMEKFFLSPIENPIGKDLIEEMKENGYKYLSEHPDYDIQYIKKIVNNWYKR